METTIVSPNPWMILPFGVLLATIALGPLFFADWWGKHYPKVAFALAAIPLFYYLAILRAYYDVVFDRRPRQGRKVTVGVDPPY